MNILPKKSFHVLSKDNVARVRKDEKEANEQARKLKERSIKAEQEWRLRSLRKDNTEKIGIDSTDSFILLNEANSQVSNIERREEREREKAKNEMKMGVLTFLGGSEWDPVKKKSRPPWYTQTSDKATEIRDEKGKDEAIKCRDDPLALMKAILTPPRKSEKYGRGINPSGTDRSKQFKSHNISLDKTRRERNDAQIVEKTRKRQNRKDFQRYEFM
ncbi:Leukocyte receptor cluster member 1 [Oopsacas minuta]|uniref:Leukocyte receptor cluster member 1 n=1 Tax=Oopsacas minuta TaxID=111878 RepID=A0AAV7JW89_9METZ|nr:Leukocyte receptor cluster member 1 [Oopsacas minuta]